MLCNNFSLIVFETIMPYRIRSYSKIKLISDFLVLAFKKNSLLRTHFVRGKRKNDRNWASMSFIYYLYVLSFGIITYWNNLFDRLNSIQNVSRILFVFLRIKSVCKLKVPAVPSLTLCPFRAFGQYWRFLIWWSF